MTSPVLSTLGRAMPILTPAAVIVIPAVLVIIATTQGVALDWDAVVYLSAADSFAESGRLIDFRGVELTTFAPGLPTGVGMLIAAGLDSNAVGRAVGVVSVLVVGACSYLIARWVLRSAALALLVTAAICLSVSTVRVFSYLKTEAPFGALVMIVSVLCLWAIRERRTPWWWVVGIGAAASLATTVRYIGFVLVPAAVLAVLLAHRASLRRDGSRRTVARILLLAATAGAAATVGLMLVSLRNLSLGAPPLGPRHPSGLTLPAVLGDLLGVLGAYLLPARQPALPQQLLGALVLGLIVCGVVVALATRSAPGVWLASMIGGYLAVLLYSEINTVIQPVSERLVAPVFPLIVVLVAFGLESVCRQPQIDGTPRRALAQPLSGSRRVVRAGSLAVAAVVLLVSTAASLSFTARSAHKGIGYNSVAANGSPTRSAVQQLPADAGLAAMSGPNVYLAVRRGPIETIPWTNFFSRGSMQPKVRELKRAVDAGEVDYLVYFKRDRRSKVVTAKELRAAGFELKRVGKFKDGEIWRTVR